MEEKINKEQKKKLEEKGIVFLYDKPTKASQDRLDALDTLDKVIEVGRKEYGKY
jgi:hypothetical protein